jgi:Sushi repeat (SCR repeat)
MTKSPIFATMTICLFNSKKSQMIAHVSTGFGTVLFRIAVLIFLHSEIQFKLMKCFTFKVELIQRKGCLWFTQTTFVASLEDARRFYGIHLVTNNTKIASDITIVGVVNGNVAMKYLGPDPTVEPVPVKSDLYGYFFFITQEEKFSKILVRAKKDVYICYFKVLAMYDDCGHPEIPLNGQVQWEPGDTRATYRCERGFQLEPPAQSRECVRGTWTGVEPICEFI